MYRAHGESGEIVEVSWPGELLLGAELPTPASPEGDGYGFRQANQSRIIRHLKMLAGRVSTWASEFRRRRSDVQAAQMARSCLLLPFQDLLTGSEHLIGRQAQAIPVRGSWSHWNLEDCISLHSSSSSSVITEPQKRMRQWLQRMALLEQHQDARTHWFRQLA